MILLGMLAVAGLTAAASALPAEDQPQAGQERILAYAEQMPRFNKGGLDKFHQWAEKQARCPKDAQGKKCRGRVLVLFVVNGDGSVSDVAIQSAPDSLLAQAATELVLSSPRWEPGEQHGQKVRVRFQMPIDFRR